MGGGAGWELWEAPNGRRHLVLGGQAMCMRGWPIRRWSRIDSGFLSCARCAKRFGWSYVTANGELDKEAKGRRLVYTPNMHDWPDA